ncbi:hypothetical protein FOCC_FOCC006173 [Frankliniella occidentalis]|nr:hypothetical protein FOCC_FOCC006173 [Frankliniella occidentalis]
MASKSKAQTGCGPGYSRKELLALLAAAAGGGRDQLKGKQRESARAAGTQRPHQLPLLMCYALLVLCRRRCGPAPYLTCAPDPENPDPRIKPKDAFDKVVQWQKNKRGVCTAATKPNKSAPFCGVAGKRRWDIVMYTMHMGYHGYQDPFQCNMCGQQTTDKVAFFLHIARSSHS